MENEQIIQTLKLTAALLELHDADQNKIKSLQSAVFKLDQLNDSLAEMSDERLEKLEGVGKSLATTIKEIITTGLTTELTDLAKITPKGVIEMLSIKGLGPKKVKTIWKELEIIKKKELLIACNENKISSLKGFGIKTQESIKQALLFTEQHKGKFLYVEVEGIAFDIEKILKDAFPDALVSISGEVRRKMEVVETLQYVIGAENPFSVVERINSISTFAKSDQDSSPFVWCGSEVLMGSKVEIRVYQKNEFYQKLLLYSCDEAHLKTEIKENVTIGKYLNKSKPVSEKDFFAELGMQFIEPEMREGMGEVDKAKKGILPDLLKEEDLKGILHNHTTYSDGIHTLEQMATYCKGLGFEYLGICDHSKAAYYANGLYENRVIQQQKEIDSLNLKLAPFKIFKGIEADILSDGSLDYEENFLNNFEFIVASVHSNLKMSQDKAMERLMKAIENPFTTILGHPTGRLLLKRDGYPIDHKKIIEACIANNVVVELNSNPRRLDMDWRWLCYALEKGAWVSVNPDAHSMKEYHNMKYGVLVGRKAGLSKERTFNSLSLSQIEKHFKDKRSSVQKIS